MLGLKSDYIRTLPLLCEAEGALLPKTVVPTVVGNSYYRRQNYEDTQKF